MPLFVCEKCQTIENTALSNFWTRHLIGGGEFIFGEESDLSARTLALCSACDPKIGEWHGRFPRTTYDRTQRVQWVDGDWAECDE